LHDGTITCRSDRWSRDAGSTFKRITAMFGGTPFGDPTQDVAKGIARVRARLTEAGIVEEKQPPIDGLIVFTNPAVKLRVEGSVYPVVTLKSIRNNVRGGKGPRERALDERGATGVVQALTG
jgi:hypothetical protein